MSSGRQPRIAMNRHHQGQYDDHQLDRMRWIASLWFVGYVGMAGIVTCEQWAPAVPDVARMALGFALV